ncbi:hypothetical protein OHD27_02785 [Escherichia coli]|nr:hypothetical protein [Escherichia coli]
MRRPHDRQAERHGTAPVGKVCDNPLALNNDVRVAGRLKARELDSRPEWAGEWEETPRTVCRR